MSKGREIGAYPTICKNTYTVHIHLQIARGFSKYVERLLPTGTAEIEMGEIHALWLHSSNYSA